MSLQGYCVDTFMREETGLGNNSVVHSQALVWNAVVEYVTAEKSEKCNTATFKNRERSCRPILVAGPQIVERKVLLKKFQEETIIDFSL